MRRMLVFITIFSFISMAALGFSAMAHGSEHGFTGCIASAFQRADCPDVLAPLSMATLHIKLFSAFSSAVFWQDVLIAVLSILLAFILFSLKVHTEPALHHFNSSSKQADYTSHSFQELIHWLALHQNSPAFS